MAEPQSGLKLSWSLVAEPQSGLKLSWSLMAEPQSGLKLSRSLAAESHPGLQSSAGAWLSLSPSRPLRLSRRSAGILAETE